MLFRRILVAYDGSEQSKHALNTAVDMAHSNRGRIFILTVVPRVTMPVYPDEGFGSLPMTTPGDWTDYQEKMMATYRKSQEDATNAVKAQFPTLPVDTIIMEGRPSSTIVEQAEKSQADLIVMGSRGIGGISGWILGSTSRRVVESCTKPVLIIK